MIRRSLATLAMLLAALAAPASAHHGFTGRYDASRPLWIEGVVTRAYFGQPHAEVVIRTEPTLAPPTTRPALGSAADIIGDRPLEVRADTRGRVVRIEFPPVAAFFALGTSVSVGDRVAVIAYRNCEAPHQLRGQWIRPESGRPTVRSGRVQAQVEGC